MAEKSELNKELKKLNKHLKELRNSGKHMLYSANPFKFAIFNFMAGIFHSLGSLFGYIVIFGVIAYFLSQANLGNLMGKWVEESLQNVDWEKIMPMPESNVQDLNQTDVEQLQEQLGR